jgi:hypothetical protein
MAKAGKSRENDYSITFPVKGLNTSTAYSEQPKDTAPQGINVRAYDPRTDRQVRRRPHLAHRPRAERPEQAVLPGERGARGHGRRGAYQSLPINCRRPR